MAWVADYTARIAPSALKAAGVVGVCRYLSPIQQNTAWKRITQPEYDELRAAGIDVLLNWEYAATDWLGGTAAGASHGQQAAAQAKGFDHPAGKPIAGSADFDMTSAQWNAAGRAYAVAFRDAVEAAGYRAGVYGPSDVLGWCQALGYTTFWQSMSTAFSGGRNGRQWSGTSIWQRRQVTMAGSMADYNDLIRQDWNGGDMTTYLDLDAQDIAPGVDNRTALRDIWASTAGAVNGDDPLGRFGKPNPYKEIEKAVGNVTAATLSDAQYRDLRTALLAAQPTAADVAAHLDYAALGAAVAQHIKVS